MSIALRMVRTRHAMLEIELLYQLLELCAQKLRPIGSPPRPEYETWLPSAFG